MNRYLFCFSRLIAILATMVISISLLGKGLVVRSSLTLVLLLLFLISSFLFEQKRRKISISYLFVFFSLFITYTLVPAYYTEDMLRVLDSTDKFSGLIADYYSIYFIVVFLCYCLLIPYLVFTRKRIVQTKLFNISNNDFCSFSSF